MIDWLGRSAEPAVDVAGRSLPLAIRRHPRARRMTLRLAPDGSEVRVTIPRWGRTGDAIAFASSRSDWLAGQLRKVPDKVELANGSEILFRGESVRIAWSPRHSRIVRQEGGTLIVGGPEDRVGARVQAWLERQALDLMGTDLARYCARAGVETPRLALSRARRRWGSCSTSGTVRINWRLVQAPDFVRQSVVAHEVAHLVHFDHGREFHRLLERLYGESLDEADGWLKHHGRALYAAFP